MANQIFSKGMLMSDNFTGESFVNFLITDPKGVYDCTVYDVVFSPKSRNFWHTHPQGQLLLCTDGIGYYQERGKEARRLQRGDVVEIPPDAEHWHGASPDSDFTHIGITPSMHKGLTVWCGEVTDEEYNAATAEQN